VSSILSCHTYNADPGQITQPPQPCPFTQDFATKQDEAIILSADDEAGQSFYFSKPILSFLSGFFQSLPAPSVPQDIYQDTPVIRLHDTTSKGLHCLLEVIRSIPNLEPISEDEARLKFGPEGLLGAALVAKSYDIPGVYRIV
jgi:hypothetical protein